MLNTLEIVKNVKTSEYIDPYKVNKYSSLTFQILSILVYLDTYILRHDTIQFGNFIYNKYNLINKGHKYVR